MALVITLILLSVITFMAVTFLVVSRRESEQVNTLTQQNTARFAANLAADAAQSQVIALIQANNNGYNFGLLVSTNFLSSFFDDSAPGTPGYSSITNVNYRYSNGKTNFSTADLGQLMNNLLVLPRVPVFFVSNRNQTSTDFRFYLDLNRNGKYDSNGWVGLLGTNGIVIKDSGGNVVTNFVIGDPEWIGILDHPDMRHSSSNFFIGRYAFIALPIGNTLDFNAIHNAAKQIRPIGANADAYLRNQGVSSWELNLAGFLNGLNTNLWPDTIGSFNYSTDLAGQSSGPAFLDAAQFIQYRYNGVFNGLRPFGAMYPTKGPAIFNGDVDTYSSGPLMTNLLPLTLPDSAVEVGGVSWSGDNNPNHFFTTQDLMNPGSAPALVNFITRMTNASAAANGLDPSTYNQYTFYRMLSEIGVESSPEPYPYPYHTKMNLNFVNVSTGPTNSIPSTNFASWAPVQFFTNAAIRLIRSRPEFTQANVNLCPGGTIHIPIYPTNFYTPALHRMLQLAANIYDATTNKTPVAGFDYPSVFRPTFGVSGTNIFINGYAEETGGIGNNNYQAQPYSLPDQAATIISQINTVTNIYGIPWVIGAKKGFPNFNAFAMHSVAQLSRKVQINKVTAGSARSQWHTNVQYTVGISNVLGVDAWNSYGKATYSNGYYGRPIQIFGADVLTMVLTNELGMLTNFTLSPTNAPGAMNWLYTLNQWTNFPNSINSNQNAVSFQVPLATNVIFLSNLVYHPFSFPRFTTGTNFDNTYLNGYPEPHFVLNMTNRLRFALVDQATGRVIDFVEFNGMDLNRDLMTELQGTDDFGPGGVWDTNRLNNSLVATVPIKGIINQINVSLHTPPYTTPGYTTPVSATDWQLAQIQQLGYSSVAAAVADFNNFYNSTGLNTNIVMQVPFTPTRKVSIMMKWEANDPLVHYTLADLAETPVTNYWNLAGVANQFPLPIGQVSTRYSPWGGNRWKQASDPYATQMAVKDFGVFTSDNWQFPTNKFPTIGWLGRVHRGTPWQTIYLKPTPIDINTWQGWVGSTNNPSYHWLTWMGNFYTNYFGFSTNTLDSVMAQPVNDWRIMDLFTTAPNENASRGQLSINQTNMAAWMAVFDGVIAMTNGNSGMTGFPIDPYTNNNALVSIVSAINSQRTNFPGQVFTNLGDILSVSNLTVTSPFLNPGNTANLSDAAYEWLPQQILSLLRVGTPRYVIYAYGQSLKPADHSLIQASGPYFGICTNYQITGEVLTRTVVRFEPTDPTMLGFPPAYTNVSGSFPMRPVIESFAVLPPE